jgi:iron complex outermembrane recepter protein
MFAKFKVTDKFALRAGVSNMLDKGIPIVNSSETGTDAALYDIICCLFYMGVKVGF